MKFNKICFIINGYLSVVSATFFNDFNVEMFYVLKFFLLSAQ